MATIVIGGGTGFIGSALSHALKERGHKLILITRKKGGDSGVWDETFSWEALKRSLLPPCDAVINLAGTPIFARRWSESYKREIFSSRIDTTWLLARAIRQSTAPPKLFISTSAAHYYPTNQARSFVEEDAPGDSFLALIAQKWEEAAHLAENSQTRLATVRIGLPLSREGGLLKRMLPLFRAGLGGPIGKGSQPFPWIHIDDLVQLFLFILSNDAAKGPFNAAAPEATSQRTFAISLASRLHRPACCPLPAPLLKLLLGQRATLLLDGASVVPKHALDLGFIFRYPTLGAALANLL